MIDHLIVIAVLGILFLIGVSVAGLSFYYPRVVAWGLGIIFFVNFYMFLLKLVQS